MEAQITTNHLNWGGDKKHMARHETVIQEYRRHLGNKIPRNRQYWTLCGKCGDGGRLIPGCELDHVVSEGLIKAKQFHGVERELSIWAENIKINSPANFYHNDFYSQLISAYHSKSLRPSVINVDVLNMPRRGSVIFSKIMLLTACLEMSKIMVVGNFILKNAYRNQMVAPDEIIDELQGEACFEFAFEKCSWKFENRCYVYNGAGADGKSQMGSVIFIKL